MKHGAIPFYVEREVKPPGETDPYYFLIAPVRAARVYDSSLSKPGRICRTEFCREFLTTDATSCKHCGAAIDSSKPRRKLRKHRR